MSVEIYTFSCNNMEIIIWCMKNMENTVQSVRIVLISIKDASAQLKIIS